MGKVEVNGKDNNRDSPEYGRADRFVRRALNSYYRALSYYGYTYEKALNTLIGYIVRIQKLGRQVITTEQREAAATRVYHLIRQLQGYERSQGSPPEKSGTWTTGKAETTYDMARWAQPQIRHRGAFPDAKNDPVLRHMLAACYDDQYVDYRDPAVILANYKIRASERLKTVLPPRRARQFVLTTDL